MHCTIAIPPSPPARECRRVSAAAKNQQVLGLYARPRVFEELDKELSGLLLLMFRESGKAGNAPEHQTGAHIVPLLTKAKGTTW